jgi:hypothetical protein
VIRLSKVRVFVLQFGRHVFLRLHVVKLLQDHLCESPVIQSYELVAVLFEVPPKHPLYLKVRNQDALDLGVLYGYLLSYLRYLGEVEVVECHNVLNP